MSTHDFRGTSQWKWKPSIVMSKLTHALPSKPSQNVNNEAWQNHMLVDPIFNNLGPIDITIEAQEYGNILLNGLHRSEYWLLGRNTHLRWILSGATKKNSKTISNQIASMFTTADVSKFCESEETSQPVHLPDDIKWEKQFKAIHLRDNDGKYIAKIPFKKIHPLGDNQKQDQWQDCSSWRKGFYETKTWNKNVNNSWWNTRKWVPNKEFSSLASSIAAASSNLERVFLVFIGATFNFATNTCALIIRLYRLF